MSANALDVQAALRDPAGTFSSPEEVATHSALSREQKIEILRIWEYDAAEEQVATEEGMPGGDNGVLSRILLALESLGADFNAGAAAPTKHRALVSRRSNKSS